MEISKQEAITLLAGYYNDQRQEEETDTELVTRIRNTMRERYNQKVDNRLKQIVKREYYKSNPDDEETVASLD